MNSLAEIAQTDPTWSLEELVDVANQLLPHYLPTTRGNTRVREEINPRLVRHYASLGMLDEPQKSGKYAVYTYRHLLQLLVVRRLLSEGVGANAINQLATQKSNCELEILLTGGVQLEVTPANPALAYLQQLKQENTRDFAIESQKSLKVTVASEKVKIPQTKTNQWVRIEIIPGLEIHIRADFNYPNSLSEQQLLSQQILQTIEDFINQKEKTMIMQEPTIEFIPLRGAISSDAATTLDLIVRIMPPNVETTLKRPKLNLGLVIDRSGSMAGQKIEYARQAACYAVQQLLPTDRVSITIYDDRIEILVPSTPALNKTEIIRKIKTISDRGSTALHAGWVEGSVQVSQYLQDEQLNRVILLSDGLANVGETNPDVIASNVHGLAQRGVSTSTMGIGDDYNEDLMEAMAKSGDGNYYYIQSPEQLPTIFQAELQGIMATVGQKVSVGVEPQGEVVVLDVFNDLDKTVYDRYKLPNLIVGNSIDLAVRLKVPPMKTQGDICRFRLAWDDSETSQRRTLRTTLQLPVVTAAQLSEFPINPEVSQLIAQLMAARAKEEAIRNLDRGDRVAAKSILQVAREQFAPSVAMSSPIRAQELADLDELDAQLDANEDKKMRKSATYQTYQRRRNRQD